jgi:hypothetical protein
VLLLVVYVVVDAQDDRHVRIGGRSRDDDLLRPRFQVLLRVLSLCEEPRGLDDDVDVEVLPGERRRVLFVQQLEVEVADADAAVRGLDLVVQRAEDGVVLEQMGHRLGVADVVDGDELDIGAAFAGSAEEVPPDPPETVHANPYAHLSSLSCPRRAILLAPGCPTGTRDERAGGEAPRTTSPSG